MDGALKAADRRTAKKKAAARKLRRGLNSTISGASLPVSSRKRPPPPFRRTFDTAGEAAERFAAENADFLTPVRDRGEPKEAVLEWLRSNAHGRTGRMQARDLSQTPWAKRMLADPDPILAALRNVFGHAKGRRWDRVDWDAIRALGETLAEFAGEDAGTGGWTWFPIAIEDDDAKILDRLSVEGDPEAYRRFAASLSEREVEQVAQTYAEEVGRLAQCMPPQRRTIVQERLAEILTWKTKGIPDSVCGQKVYAGHTCDLEPLHGELRQLRDACESDAAFMRWRNAAVQRSPRPGSAAADVEDGGGPVPLVPVEAFEGEEPETPSCTLSEAARVMGSAGNRKRRKEAKSRRKLREERAAKRRAERERISAERKAQRESRSKASAKKPPATAGASKESSAAKGKAATPTSTRTRSTTKGSKAPTKATASTKGKAPAKANAAKVSSAAFDADAANRVLGPTGWQLTEVTVNATTGFVRVSVEQRDYTSKRGRLVTLLRSGRASAVVVVRDVTALMAGAFESFWTVLDTLGQERFGTLSEGLEHLGTYLRDNGKGAVASAAIRGVLQPLASTSGLAFRGGDTPSPASKQQVATKLRFFGRDAESKDRRMDRAAGLAVLQGGAPPPWAVYVFAHHQSRKFRDVKGSGDSRAAIYGPFGIHFHLDRSLQVLRQQLVDDRLSSDDRELLEALEGFRARLGPPSPTVAAEGKKDDFPAAPEGLSLEERIVRGSPRDRMLFERHGDDDIGTLVVQFIDGRVTVAQNTRLEEHGLARGGVLTDDGWVLYQSIKGGGDPRAAPTTNQTGGWTFYTGWAPKHYRAAGYATAVRDPLSGQESPDRAAKRARWGVAPHLAIKRLDKATLGAAMLEDLPSIEPATLHKIGLVSFGLAGNVVHGTKVEEALWDLVDAGQVEHTLSTMMGLAKERAKEKFDFVLFRTRGSTKNPSAELIAAFEASQAARAERRAEREAAEKAAQEAYEAKDRVETVPVGDVFTPEVMRQVQPKHVAKAIKRVVETRRLLPAGHRLSARTPRAGVVYLSDSTRGRRDPAGVEAGMQTLFPQYRAKLGQWELHLVPGSRGSVDQLTVLTRAYADTLRVLALREAGVATDEGTLLDEAVPPVNEGAVRMARPKKCGAQWCAEVAGEARVGDPLRVASRQGKHWDAVVTEVVQTRTAKGRGRKPGVVSLVRATRLPPRVLRGRSGQSAGSSGAARTPAVTEASGRQGSLVTPEEEGFALTHPKGTAAVHGKAAGTGGTQSVLPGVSRKVSAKALTEMKEREQGRKRAAAKLSDMSRMTTSVLSSTLFDLEAGGVADGSPAQRKAHHKHVAAVLDELLTRGGLEPLPAARSSEQASDQVLATMSEVDVDNALRGGALAAARWVATNIGYALAEDFAARGISIVREAESQRSRRAQSLYLVQDGALVGYQGVRSRLTVRRHGDDYVLEVEGWPVEVADLARRRARAVFEDPRLGMRDRGDGSTWRRP